ncbi:hypothetical protein U1Q18_022624 [Sarracenia purpurea var. burkii]
MLDPEDREAVIANAALKQAITDYRVIVELSCTSSPEELLDMKRAYRARYKHSLEEQLAAHTSGDLRERYDGNEIDTKLANSESIVLHNTIKDKVLNHDEIMRIVSTRSKAQLIATFNHYKDDYGTSITKVKMTYLTFCKILDMYPIHLL